MSEEKLYTPEQAHAEFAKQTNNRVWALLGQPQRATADDEEMIENAYASLYHWPFAGQKVHLQRGEWLLAHVITVLGEAKPAL